MSKSRPIRLRVLRAFDLGPHLRRVVLGGPGFAELEAMDVHYTDRYVKLVFLAPGAEYPTPLDLDEIKTTMDPAVWPVLRTYSLRRIDRDAQEIWIDFVVHGDTGLAGPWALAAQPGDEIYVRRPGGAYTPNHEVDWHLFVGDEAALPAISSSIEALPAGAHATAVLEVDSAADELQFDTAANLTVQWLHRAPAEPGTTSMLDDAVRALDFPEGRVGAFVHGEAALLRTVRKYLVDERGVDRADLSISAYWRHGDTEESFREWKAAQKEAVMRPAQ